ncbi:hypothetical protein DH2020_046949 [Rehmannia glutinosa]|uniref:Uncharacterized protein n=1 Tax=Rehmannia glutinosa TaxID=99300 RepID=A0ABR0UAJ3_REHGL
MEPTAPGKSQPLHNFDLPRLKWNKDANSSTHHRRRRSIKSPSRRPTTSSASPISHSPLRGSVSATPPRRESPLRDSATPPRRNSPLRDSAALPPRESPVRGDFMMKQSPVRGKPSLPFPIRECYILDSLINGDSERLSLLREEAMRLFLRGDSPSEFEALRKSKVASIEYSRNHSRYSAFDRMRNEIEQIKEKIQKKSKVTEVGIGGIKRSKLLIKIPFKNSTLVEENSQEGPLKIANNGEHGGTDVGQEAGKINNNVDEETKIWNLRPRKPKRKTQNVTVGAEKGNFSKMPEKNKSQSPLKNSNKSGEKRNCSSGGGEKKEKSEKKEKRKLSISIPLSKGEIQEDIFSLTGLKPARRPKKRAKNIQKQVDSVFPGLCLVSITPDSYKVPANYMKMQRAKDSLPFKCASGKFKVPGFHCSDGICKKIDIAVFCYLRSWNVSFGDETGKVISLLSEV